MLQLTLSFGLSFTSLKIRSTLCSVRHDNVSTPVYLWVIKWLYSVFTMELNVKMVSICVGIFQILGLIKLRINEFLFADRGCLILCSVVLYFRICAG